MPRFSNEANCYIVVSDDRIHRLSAATGIEFDNRAKDNTNCLGIFATGRMIGRIFASQVLLWDPVENFERGYDSEGSSIQDVDDESGADWAVPTPYLGGVLDARQNTWTGQVSMGTQHGGNYGMVTFIPSVVEPKEENSFIASPDSEDLTPYDKLLGRKWVRDWSYRIPGYSKLRLLEGESSIAASLYAAIFAVPEFDSKRWGGGLPESFASLPSFESLHARCVAPERYIRSNASRWETDLALKKAYVFTVQICGTSGKHEETFQPDDSTAYTWRSAEGGVLWFNETTSPLYDADLDADDLFVLMTKPMLDHDRYMVGNKTNSKSPPTSRSSWKTGKHSIRCPQQHIPGTLVFMTPNLKLLGIRAITRSEDTITSPEQKAETIYSERFKVDYVLDAQTSLSQLTDDIMLAACNGFRTMIDGKLHVGINPSGRLQMMALTDDMRVGSGTLTLAAGQRPNLILLEYQNRFDEYRSDFQPAYDDFEQDATGQAIIESPSNPGITRPGQAQLVSSLMRDVVASHKRQYTATDNAVGISLSAGDSVGIWDRENGLDGDLFIVNNWGETEDRTIKLVATEHVPLAAGTRQADASDRRRRERAAIRR